MSSNPPPDPSEPIGPPAGCDRRRFVGLVTAGAALGWLADEIPAWSATISSPSSSRLVPGYLRDSHLAVQDQDVLHTLSDFRIPLHETLRPLIPDTTPMEFVSSVDPGPIPRGFKSGRARIWIHGLLPPGSASLVTGLKAIHLGAEMLGQTGKDPVRHYVWGFTENPVENLSGATLFEMSASPENVVRLVASFESPQQPGGGKTGGGGGLGECHTELAFTDRRDQPKLRPGVYCLPLNDEAQWAFPLVANHDWLVPEDLPYLLFSVQELD